MADPGFHVKGGAQFSIRKVFPCERRKHDAMLGGPGHATPIFFEKQNCATRCILVHSRAYFSLLYFAVFEVIFYKNVAFADKSANKKRE